MGDLKFKLVRIQLARRDEIRLVLEAQGIELLRPSTSLSDQDDILQKCQEIAVKVNISIDELASYFYLLRFEAEQEIFSFFRNIRFFQRRDPLTGVLDAAAVEKSNIRSF